MVNGKKGRQACKEYWRKKDRQGGRKVEQVEGKTEEKYIGSGEGR